MARLNTQMVCEFQKVIHVPKHKPRYGSKMIVSWLVDACLDKYGKVPMTQNQFDALTSLVYNIGETAFVKSTLLGVLNQNSNKLTAEQFDRWGMTMVKNTRTR